MGYNKNSCNELISQMRNYILQEPPFNSPYIPINDTPLKWWNTCFTSGNQLQTLAIKLFSITSHATSCERTWSSVGWIYGKRRTRLSIQTIESLTKIYRYYMTNIKNELHYYQLAMSKEEIIQMIEDSLSESYEKPIEEDKAQIISNLNSLEPIIQYEEDEILNISNSFNLEPLIVVEYVDTSRFNQNNLDEETNEEDNDYDIEELVKTIM